MRYDVMLQGGTVFDGVSEEGVVADVALRAGRVVEIALGLDASRADRVVDATGQWVMPGFIDNHTHYDAELLAAPGLNESVRHGVTTVAVGSCSLSTIAATPEDCADLFSRVEALPRPFVLETLTRHKTWATPREYAAAVDGLMLGPNVASYLGHSDVRTAVMGLGAATDGAVRPSEAQQEAMERMLGDALDEGFMGFSTMTNPWDKVGGDRYRSRRLPSTYATWGEYRRFNRILRERNRILQSAPNITTKVNALLFIAGSAGYGVRKPLKTTLITAADVKANPALSAVVTDGVEFANRVLGANVRWQSVPMPFEVYADGIDLVVFEEFGAGEEALHLTERVERDKLFADPAYRRRFRKDYARKFAPRVWHRDFYDAHVVDAPDASLVGKSFGEIADARNEHPVDVFLDLVMEHGTRLRWRTTIANHRLPQLERLVAHPSVQIGFADSGAHIRNMAFYNFPLVFLRTVKRAAERGAALMTMGRAVSRVTAEQADWYGLDAGHLRVGDRADVVVVNPAGLDDSLDVIHEAAMPGSAGVQRMVRRNDAAVTATIIGGEIAYERGRFVEGYGTTRAFGRFLRADQKVAPRVPSTAERRLAA